MKNVEEVNDDACISITKDVNYFSNSPQVNRHDKFKTLVGGEVD